MITHDELLRLLQCDPVTGAWVRLVAVSGRRVGEIVGGVKTDSHGYKRRHIKINGKSYRANRLAHFYVTGAWPDKLVDHADGDSLNDSWINLRGASYNQNTSNSRTWSSSGIKNVHSSNGKWVVVVGVDKKRQYFGCYHDLELAALVANEARSKLHAEFASER